MIHQIFPWYQRQCSGVQQKQTTERLLLRAPSVFQTFFNPMQVTFLCLCVIDSFCYKTSTGTEAYALCVSPPKLIRPCCTLCEIVVWPDPTASFLQYESLVFLITLRAPVSFFGLLPCRLFSLSHLSSKLSFIPYQCVCEREWERPFFWMPVVFVVCPCPKALESTRESQKQT